MKTHWIKIALRGVSPMIWRRLQVPGNLSLAELHHVIQIAYDWDDEHLHQFHIYGKDYGINKIGAVMFSENVYEILLDDFDFDSGDKFTYEYNFLKHCLVDIRIENIKNAAQTSACCIKGDGMIGANKYDEVEPTLNLLKAIVNADEATTMDDIRPLVDALNAVRFNRHNINYRLQTECTQES